MCAWERVLFMTTMTGRSVECRRKLKWTSGDCVSYIALDGEEPQLQKGVVFIPERWFAGPPGDVDSDEYLTVTFHAHPPEQRVKVSGGLTAGQRREVLRYAVAALARGLIEEAERESDTELTGWLHDLLDQLPRLDLE